MTSRRPRPPPPKPLENDDLLSEILLRLPPQPSSLPRASAVSRRWRGVASDPRFSHRFRARHRRRPPLLGCFVKKYQPNYRFIIHFEPALEAPNRVPRGRFLVPIDDDAGDRFLGCRHGLALIFHLPRNQLTVWDPVAGDKHRLDIPFPRVNSTSAAVLRPAGDVRRFHVVSVGTSYKQQPLAVASVYSSETGRWGDLLSTQLRFDNDWFDEDVPAVMIGDSLYWMLTWNDILEFDLGKQSLALIPMPEEMDAVMWPRLGHLWVLPAEDGGLGLLLVSGFSAQLWKRKANRDGAASWVPERAIALDTLLSINLKERRDPFILGFAEENNMILLWTSSGVFTVQLQSLEFKKLSEAREWRHFYPFECVYVAGTRNQVI